MKRASLKTIPLILAITLVAACSPKNTESKPTEKPQGVLTDAQKQTLEKAKQTDDMVKEATEKRMKDAEQ